MLRMCVFFLRIAGELVVSICPDSNESSVTQYIVIVFIFAGLVPKAIAEVKYTAGNFTDFFAIQIYCRFS